MRDTGAMLMATYIENELYDRAASALAELKPCELAGRVTVDQIKIVLGEIGDIWPTSIENDPEKHRLTS